MSALVFPRLVGIDIETDTSMVEVGGVLRSGGLDPAFTRIVNVAVVGDDFEEVFECDSVDDERLMLADLDMFLADLPPSFLVSWNGSVFDFPFLASRAAFHQLPIGLHLTHDDAIVPKYDPTPGFAGGVAVSWRNRTPVPHAHFDVAYLYTQAAADAGVSWSLKPVARYFGLEPVEIDRTRIHEADPQLLRDYVLSDAACTRALAARLLATA